MPEGNADVEVNLDRNDKNSLDLIIADEKPGLDLAGYYQKELARLQQSSKDEYELLKDQVKSQEDKKSRQTLPPPRTFSLQDKIRHEMLTQEAMFKGTGDLGKFQRLIEYFEATMTDIEYKYERFKKELSREQKDEIRKERAAKGWWPYFRDKDKYTELELTRKVPFNITRKNIGVLKELSEVIGEPVKVIEVLREAGMDLSRYFLDGNNPEGLNRLKALISAPFVQDVLPIIRGIPNWDSKAFDFLSFYSDSTDAIDILTNLAKLPDTATTFTPEAIEKISILASSMGTKMTSFVLDNYLQIINDPEKFDFLVIALRNKDQYFPISDHDIERLDISNELEGLKNAGLLMPITKLLKSGVDINDQIFNGSRYNFRKHEYIDKTQDQVIHDLQSLINQPEIQDYLQSSEKQEFVALLSDLTGSRIGIEHLQDILKFFDKKEELVFLYKLVYNNPEHRKKLLEIKGTNDTRMPLGVVANIINNEDWVEIITNTEFLAFLDELKKQGLNLTPKSFYDPELFDDNQYSVYRAGNPLIEVFKSKFLIDLFGKDNPKEFLELLQNGDSEALKRLEYYKNLASFGENIINTIRLAKQYNLIDASEDLPNISKLNAIRNMWLLQKDVLEKVPEIYKQTWVQTVVKLDTYAQGVLKTQISNIDVVSEEFIRRVEDIVQTFNQAQLFFKGYPYPSLQDEIMAYQGNVLDLFKDGQPTPILAQIFLDKKEFNYFHRFLTDDVIASFPKDIQEGLILWRGLSFDIRNIISEQVENFPYVSSESLERYRKTAEMVNSIQNSSSKEIKKLQPEIIQQLWQVDNPEIYLARIIDVFEKNNMPLVGKVFKVFEILHPPKTLEEKLHSKRNLSPVLMSADTDQRYGIIYRDLLKVAIESNNPSLRNFLSAMQEGYQVIEEIEQNGVEILDLPENAGKRESALRFLNRLNTISSASFYGKKHDVFLDPGKELAERLVQIKESLGIKGNQSLMHRVSALFLRPLGYSSIEQVLDHMDKVKADANERNLALVEDSPEGISLEAGDLLKGVNLDYLDNILLNGSVAKEYLGASADSDMTPFDTDTSMVLSEDLSEGFEGAISKSVAGSYGGLLLIIKDKGQFQKPAHNAPASYEKDKYELFSSGVHGEHHWGIRTGIPSTQFDGMVALDSLAQDKEKMQRIYFTIAQNGVYIPVVDKEGKVIFTPEMYDEYRIKDHLIEEELRSTDFKPDLLIGILEESPFIKSLYESSVGVSEGYNLKEHTTMVLSQYEKYFADRWRSPLISQEGFRLLLALHDLGKPLVVKVTGSTSEQHEYTMKFLPKIVESMNLKPQEIEVIAGIASQDYLGQYLQNQSSAEATAENIKSLAHSLGVPVTQLFELIKMYYICDAGSYTEDAGGKRALDGLFIFSHPEDGSKGSVSLAPNVQQKVDELQHFLVAA